MLAYSRAAGRKISQELNSFRLFLEPCIQLSYIAYLIVCLCLGLGNLIASIAFLVCSAAYFIFWIYARIKELKKQQKLLALKIYSYARKLVKLLNLIIVVYSVYLTVTEASLFKILFSVLLIVGFILDIFCIILSYIFNEWIAYLFAGIEKDFAPLFGVVKFFNKNKGADEKDLEPSKAALHLEQMVTLEKEEAEEKKQRKKQDLKTQKKREKAIKKAAKKAAKRGHTLVVADEIAIGEDD